MDDQRKPGGDWVVTQTVAQTIELLKTGEVSELSLDHDLGEDDTIGTGYDVLLWLEEQVVTNGFKPPAIMRVHSANSAATPRMEQAIEQIARYAERNR